MIDMIKFLRKVYNAQMKPYQIISERNIDCDPFKTYHLLSQRRRTFFFLSCMTKPLLDYTATVGNKCFCSCFTLASKYCQNFPNNIYYYPNTEKKSAKHVQHFI